MSEAIKELNESNFQDTVNSGVTLVDFWAPWCGPCKMQLPILESLAGSIGDKATIAKVNVDESPSLAAQFGVRSIPTLLILKDGIVQQQMVGVQQEQDLESAINDAL